ncbi:MAG: hypothetical protein A2015_09415 [Spirochaetes bacterium GWF1_31_7]|nr:MAG: hypothetical protein A2Y30_03145 [Spirochaetes bacterium GWE1_32_154]OHD48327.1 MAG: hypothetical protein A2Y29_05660 [Spirochaetes bacterium GWE2_31_10]OHD53019.1 MAG: hypothetical protein A2015_09415 [Spirochaetes bacterium GWF1_31_7]HBD95941.1 hypothetical protein [Spirochaetia bacterium]HBI37607.1 hypothetical protein [Spirochaetia bacterium]
MKRLLISLLLLSSISSFLFAKEDVKLGFYVREGKTDLAEIKKAPTDLIVSFENTIIFDSLIEDWIKDQTEKNGKPPKVTAAGLQTEFLKSMDKLLKSGKPISRIADKSKVTKKYVIMLNVDRIVPVPMVGHTFTCRINLYEASNLETPISVMTLQIIESGGTIPGVVSDKGIGQAGLTIASQLKMLIANPKAARSEKE